MIIEQEVEGICPRKMKVVIENDIIREAHFYGGCPGNGTAVCKLIIGRTVDEVISLIDGIDCAGRGTSCPDQLALILKKYKQSK